MPVFNGNTPDGWIFKAECCFSMNQLSDAKKLEVAVISLDGEALAWFL